MSFGISGTNRTVRNREVSDYRGVHMERLDSIVQRMHTNIS